jgi:hypothetical protein
MMEDYLISMFIDDELDLDDKIVFVEAVHSDKDFKDESIDLLQQEKVIRSEVVNRLPTVDVPVKQKLRVPIWRPISIFTAGLAAAMLISFLSLPSQERLSASHRFVIYQPEVNQVEITGSFIGWKTLPMKQVGTSGYWEVTLDLAEGEHRFSYILEGNRRLADPTILTREHDDFGGENSILEVKLQA